MPPTAPGDPGAGRDGDEFLNGSQKEYERPPRMIRFFEHLGCQKYLCKVSLHAHHVQVVDQKLNGKLLKLNIRTPKVSESSGSALISEGRAVINDVIEFVCTMYKNPKENTFLVKPCKVSVTTDDGTEIAAVYQNLQYLMKNMSEKTRGDLRMVDKNGNHAATLTSSYLYGLTEKKRGVKAKDIALRSHTSALKIEGLELALEEEEEEEELEQVEEEKKEDEFEEEKERLSVEGEPKVEVGDSKEKEDEDEEEEEEEEEEMAGGEAQSESKDTTEDKLQDESENVEMSWLSEAPILAVQKLFQEGLDEENFTENGITVQLGKQEVYLDVTPIVDATLSIEDSSAESGDKSLTQQSNALARPLSKDDAKKYYPAAIRAVMQTIAATATMAAEGESNPQFLQHESFQELGFAENSDSQDGSIISLNGDGSGDQSSLVIPEEQLNQMVEYMKTNEENVEIDGDGKEIAHPNFNNQIVQPGDPISITCMVRVRTSNGESEPMIAVVKGTAGKDDSLNVQQVNIVGHKKKKAARSKLAKKVASPLRASNRKHQQAEDDRKLRVKPGDTLWSLSAKYYGNGKNFTKILQHNQSKIQNPNLIFAYDTISL